jgi:hypothetical protein
LFLSKQENVKNMNETPPPVALLQMMTGYKVSRLIYVAAKLGIADLLKDSPKSIDELAKATETDARTLYRILRTLASVGIFAEVEQSQRFTLTPLAQLLQAGIPGSLHAIAIYMGDSHHWQTFGDILYSVKTGKPAFEHTFGMPPYKYLAQNTEWAKLFNDAMTSLTATEDFAIPDSYDFSPFVKIVDVGGGHGSLIAAILKANPKMRGVLFEVPPVIEGAKHLIEAEGLAERCELVAGDAFKSVPNGGDAYILKHMIHAFDDDLAVVLLSNIHHAMPANGKILACEMVIPPGNESHFSKLIDIDMLLIPGGYERTEAEYQRLFDKAGFRLTKIFRTSSSVSVIEGVHA